MIIRSVSGYAPARWVSLTTLLSVLFLTFLDTTVVSVALGNIQYDLGAGVIPLQWVLNAYSLVFASLMLTAGSLSDRFGRKWVMLGGIVIFCGGSVLCALAPSVGYVIGGRAVMGVGAAAAEPGTLSVIRQIYPDRGQRARALGAWAAVAGLSLALGPVVGGLLVNAGSWRDVFWFNVAIGGLLFILVWLFVPNSADPQGGRLDGGGFLLGSLALGCLIYGGIAGEQYGYSTWWIVLLFVVSAVCGIAWVSVEKRVAAPMLELDYLKNSAVSSALFLAFAIYFGIFSIFFLTALYLDLIVGYDGGQMASVFAPMAIAIVAGSVVSGFWVGYAGPRGPMIVGSLLSAGGIVLARYALVQHPRFTELASTLTLSGIGFGIAVVPLTAAVLGHVPAARSGMAASATNTARQVGAVVGVAALGAIVNSKLTSDFGSRLAHRGVTGTNKDFILRMLETGGNAASGIDIAHPDPLIKPLVDDATAAFRSGLHLALIVAAILIAVAAALIALIPRGALAPDTEI